MPNCKSSNLQEAVAATGVGKSIAGTPAVVEHPTFLAQTLYLDIAENV